MTTHVFIVDATTFKYHLEYRFVGTGKGNDEIDFNNNSNTSHSPQTEIALVEMIADFTRVQIGDLAIFYLQQNFQQGIYEGKFYGVFKIASLVFLDNNDGQQFLRNELQKSLTFRCLIEPFEVYPYGVTEWEALDEIQYIHSPNQMLWSLIYRKLKGNRGNTMITMFESDRLIGLIRAKNQGRFLIGQNFSFDSNFQMIVPWAMSHLYTDRQESINILPRLIQKYRQGNQFEAHLQAYILQNFTDFCKQTMIFDGTHNERLEWLGNEVSCGVGMQRIDILASIYSIGHRKLIPIELKSDTLTCNILAQMQRYIDWLKQYYAPLHIFNLNGMCGLSIQPMIICRQINKNLKYYQDFEQECVIFNQNNHILPISYVEFNIHNDSILFEKIF